MLNRHGRRAAGGGAPCCADTAKPYRRAVLRRGYARRYRRQVVGYYSPVMGGDDGPSAADASSYE
jgi:hypothetical protein